LILRIKSALLILLVGGLFAAACNPSSNTPVPADSTRGPLPTLPDLAQLVVGDVINAATVGKVQPLGNLRGHDTTVNQLVFSHDSQWLLTLDAERIGLLWDLKTRRQRVRLGRGDTLLAFFSADDSQVGTVGANGTIAFVYTDGGRLIQDLTGNPGGISCAALSPDGSVLATGGRQGDILLWNVTSRSQQAAISGGSRGVREMAFSPDGKTLAALVNEAAQPVRFWDALTGKLLSSLPDFGTGSPRHLSYSPDGKLLAVALDTEVRLFDTATYTRRYVLQSQDLHADWSMAFSPDGALFMALGRSDFVYVWTVADGALLAKLPGHRGQAAGLVFSPDGQLVLTTSIAPRTGAFIWQSAAFKPGTADYPRTPVAQEANGILLGGWSPDGRLLALAEASGGVMLWGIPGTAR
jgi:WD40 repeat protein